MSARVGAAQELGLGLVLGRLIPFEGSPRVPGTGRSASKVVSIGWGQSIMGGSGGAFECHEQVVGSPGDLAGGRQCCTLCADARFDLEIEIAVGAFGSARGVLCRLDECPPKLRRALFGELAATAAVARLEHDRVEAGDTNQLAGAAETTSVADLGEMLYPLSYGGVFREFAGISWQTAHRSLPLDCR